MSSTAVQKAARRPTKTDIIQRNQRLIRDLYGLNRLRVAPPSTGTTVSLGGVPSSAGASGGTGNFLKTMGDSMVGPIAFLPALVSISGSDEIDISQSSGADNVPDYSTYVLVTGGGATDDLESILGAAFSGQWLIVQTALTQTITVEDFSNNVGGNIVTPDGNNIVLDGTTSAQTIQFIFDVVVSPNGNNGGWRVISQGAASGTVTFPITPPILDRGSVGSSTESIDLSLTTGHVNKMTLTGNITIALNNPPATDTQIEFELEFIQDGTGGHTVTFPASVVDTITVDATAGATTIVTLRTNDNGTIYRAVTGATGGSGQNQTPWLSNIDAASFDLTALDHIEFDGTPLGTSGRLRVANNDIILSSRDAAGTNNVELKVDAANFFDFRRTEDLQPVVLNLRARAGGADQTGTISQLGGTVGALNISTPDFLNLQIAAVTVAQIEPGALDMLSNDIIEVTDVKFSGAGGVTAGEEAILVDNLTGNMISNVLGGDAFQFMAGGVELFLMSSGRFEMNTASIFEITNINFENTKQIQSSASSLALLVDAGASLDMVVDGTRIGRIQSTQLQITSPTPNTTIAKIDLFRDDPSPVASDGVAVLQFSGTTLDTTFQEYAQIQVIIEDPSNTIPDGSMDLQAMTNASQLTYISLNDGGLGHVDIVRDLNIDDQTDITKKLTFDLTTKTTGTTDTLLFQGSNSTITFPNLSAPILAVTNANNSFSTVQTFQVGAIMSNNLTMSNNTILSTDSIEFNSDSNNRITDNGTSLRIGTALNDSIIFEEIGIKVVEFDFDSAATFSADISIVGDFVIRPTVNVGGFFCQPSGLALGSAGGLLIPFDSSSSGSAATADTDFGASVGSVGFYGGGTQGTFVMRLANGNWVGFNTTDAATPVLTAVRLT